MLRNWRVTRRIAAGFVVATLVLTAVAVPPATAAAPKTAVEAACGDPAPGTVQCLAIRRLDVVSKAVSAVSPQASPPGFGPADLQEAYALPSATAGLGLTVALVDAYDLPTAAADLAAYRSQYGLPACTVASGCFRQVTQNGQPVSRTPGNANYVAPDSGWGVEIALDIDMVSAICPNCKILLVEAATSGWSDIGTSVDQAVAMGAVAVSNSYVGAEFSGELSLDHFYNHPGVAITAATGDCGFQCVGTYGSPGNQANTVAYPAASPYVVAVGGTSLVRDSSARHWSESAWGNTYGGAGSGCSNYEPRPTWQPAGVCGEKRTESDISAVADPAAGVAIVYNGSWFVEGGTSVASPIIAAAFALDGESAAGQYPAQSLYAAPTGLNDAIGGNNDVTYHSCSQPVLCNGQAGYDGPTGLGTPNGTAAFNPIASTYTPVPPVRLLDTRTGNGSSGRIAANTPRTFQIAGRSPIPAEASAVTGNLAVTGGTNGWAVFLGPNPVAHPTSSTINFARGDTVANGITVALGSTGSLSATYMSSAGNFIHLVFDVTGYFMPNSDGQTFHALAPFRIVDSRKGHGLAHHLVANTPSTFDVRLQGEVPGNATAVTGNVTAVNATSSWAIYVGPNPIAKPTTSTVNFGRGQTRGNNTTVALSGTGTLSATYMASPGNTADLVFDVTGYFTADSSGSAYVPINPVRLLDSRVGNGFSGKLAAKTPRTVQITNRGIAAGAVGLSGNLTVTNPTSSWAIFVGPNPEASPTASTLNFVKGETRNNGLIVALGTGGVVNVVYLSGSGNTTDLVLDVTGYFRGP